MITVYFEKGLNAEIVATFETEEIYAVCTPALEAEAKKRGCIVTESVNQEKDV